MVAAYGGVRTGAGSGLDLVLVCGAVVGLTQVKHGVVLE